MPYLKETEMSRLSYLIPKAIHSKGGQIRIFVPRFGVINERRHQLHEVIRLSRVNLVIDDTDMLLIIKVASVPKDRIQIYFIDNEDYFKRKAVLEDASGTFFEDNDERSMFFVKGVLETVKKLNWVPDIIHVHGWMSALMPLYLRKHYHRESLFKHSKIVTSVYDEAFEGRLSEKMTKKLSMDGFKEKDIELLKDPTFDNLMKSAINYSDAVITLTDNLSEGLQEHISQSKSKILRLSNAENIEETCINFFNHMLYAK